MALSLDSRTVPSSTGRARLPLWPFPLAGVAGVVLVKTLLQLSVLGRYGWHRDELYYLSAGRHPALGYVDFPPIVPMLAAVSRHLFGISLVGLRSLSLVAGAGVVVLVALTARELGGGRYAQVLAAVAAAFSPLLLATNVMFQTVPFDQLAWAALLFVSARLLRTGDVRLWPVIGALAGVALMTKYTVALLLAGLAVGWLAHRSGRRLLRGWPPVVAGAIALAIVLPNLWWQIHHAWASVAFFRGQNADVRQANPFGTYVKDVLLIAGPLGLLLAAIGMRRLTRIARWRPLAWAAAVPLVGFAALGGKGYYGAPVLGLLFAAGAVSAEHWTGEGRRRWLRVAAPAVLVVSIIPALPSILPVLSRSSMVARGLDESRKDYADEIGWPELVDTVARAWQGLSPEERATAAVVAANYGEAGAIDLYGPAKGLPPAVSGHLTYRYWAPTRPDATIAVVVGAPAEALGRLCRSVDDVATLSNRAGARNEEVGRSVSVCRLRTSLEVFRRSLR